MSANFKRTRCAQAVGGALLAMLVGAAPLVQAAEPGQAPSQQDAQRSYRIPAGDLGSALSAFAGQSGVSLVVNPALVAGKRTQGLNGTVSVGNGFRHLLQGSGLEVVSHGEGKFSLHQSTTDTGAAILPAVNVTATTSMTEGTGSLTTAGPVSAATGLNLSLRETPQSVTVITRKRIEQQNLNTLADVAEQVTGVFYNNKGTPVGGRTTMYARGYEVDSYQVDGVNVPWETLAESERYGHGSLDTAIYDSVTVVRGSTGLLTGTGDPSAMMALTRKKPTQELQTILKASAGSWDRYRGMVDVGGALNKAGNLRGRVVGAYDEGDSWVDNYSNERSTFYGVMEADLGASTLLTLTLEHATADSKGAPWAEDYGVYPYFADRVTPMPKSTTNSIAPHWSYLNSDRTYASIALDHQFNDDWKAKLSYGYGKFNTDMRRGMVTTIPQDGTPTAARMLSLDYNYDTHIFDARVDGKYRLFGREHELVAGLNMYRNDQQAPLAFFGVLAGQASWNNGRLHYIDPDWSAMPGSEDDYPYDIDVKQEGAYLATRLRPADRLSVILGGRVTRWDYFYSERATAHHGYTVLSDVDYDNEFTPYAGVVVDLTKHLSTYASYTQIFKPQEVRDSSGSLLDPVEGDTYELGIKGAWFDGRLNASAAVFESKRENLAVALVDENGDPVSDSRGGQAHRAEDHTKGRGWELEVAGEPLPGWQVQAGYSKFRNKNSDGDVIDPAQPEQMFKLYTDYQVMTGLRVGGSLRWQDDTSATDAILNNAANPSLYTTDSYHVVAVNADYELTQNATVSLVVDNLLDKEYRTSSYYHTYGAPLSAIAKVRVQF